MTVVTVSPAPCSWGSTYSQPMSTTNTAHTRRSAPDRSRNSAKSGTVYAPERRSGADTNSTSAR